MQYANSFSQTTHGDENVYHLCPETHLSSNGIAYDKESGQWQLIWDNVNFIPIKCCPFCAKSLESPTDTSAYKYKNAVLQLLNSRFSTNRDALYIGNVLSNLPWVTNLVSSLPLVLDINGEVFEIRYSRDHSSWYILGPTLGSS